MSAERIDRFQQIAATNRLALPPATLEQIARLDTALQHWKTPALMREFGPAFTRTWREITAPLAPPQRRQFAALYLAQKALAIDDVLRERSLTPALLARYPLALDRLADTLEAMPDPYDFDDELFIKDLRLVLGLGVPAGACILDIRSRMGGTILLGVARRDPLRVLRTGGKIPCFRLYLDPRYREAFNREGMIDYYREAGELLAHHPDVYGFVCKSWFMDPQLERVSPRLAHLSTIPLSAGAFVITRKASDGDRARALKTSPTRRALHEAGKYEPRAVSLVWPREGMIRWAMAQRQERKA